MRASEEKCCFALNPVDKLIDLSYLQLSERAWTIVLARTNEILGSLENDPDETEPRRRGRNRPVQFRALNWLLAAREHNCPLMRSSVISTRDGMDLTGEMIEYVATHYPAFLAEEISGDYILLRGPGLMKWDRYFSSENTLYRPYNFLAAEALHRCIRDKITARVLELGAGSGGATIELITALQNRYEEIIGTFVVSDISASLLMRCRNRVMSAFGNSIEIRCLNFDRSIQCTPGEFDVVVAVNALHNAASLRGALQNIKFALAPDGVLIISESLCAIGDLVHQDFIFNLLPHRGDPEARGETSRFYSAAAWREALKDAGYSGEVWQNNTGPELALLAVVRPHS
jgi:SAM-dependent methyltransferase